MAVSKTLAIALSVGLGVSCASENGTYGVIDAASQLFLQDDENDESRGIGLMLLTTDEFSCSDFSDAVEDDFEGDGDSELLDQMLGTDAVFVALAYEAEEDAVDSLGDAWVGTFTASGAFSGQGDDQIGRSALSMWFEEGETWTEDSSGLVVTVDTYASGALTGDLWHPWGELDFDTEDCGDEDFLY